MQGVFFRGSTRSEAIRLGLAGHAKNLSSGDVEVDLCGSAADVEEMIKWLETGPPMANVDYVTEKPITCTMPRGFSTA